MSMPINQQAALAIVLSMYELTLLDLQNGKVPSEDEIKFRLEALHKTRNVIAPEAVALAAVLLGSGLNG
jgi:hypothetical protein